MDNTTAVVLVDRQEVTREVLRMVLSDCGYCVHAYEKWHDARCLLRQQRVLAVILCDWRNCGGIGAVRYLRSAAGNVPFILISDMSHLMNDERFYIMLTVEAENSSAVKARLAQTLEKLNLNQGPVILGDLILHQPQRLLTYKDENLRLTLIECQIMAALMRAGAEHLLSAQSLSALISADETANDRRAAYTHINWLRQKIISCFGGKVLIVNSKGKGYYISLGLL